MFDYESSATLTDEYCKHHGLGAESTLSDIIDLLVEKLQKLPEITLLEVQYFYEGEYLESFKTKVENEIALNVIKKKVPIIIKNQPNY